MGPYSNFFPSHLSFCFPSSFFSFVSFHPFWITIYGSPKWAAHNIFFSLPFRNSISIFLKKNISFPLCPFTILHLYFFPSTHSLIFLGKNHGPSKIGPLTRLFFFLPFRNFVFLRPKKKHYSSSTFFFLSII